MRQEDQERIEALAPIWSNILAAVCILFALSLFVTRNWCFGFVGIVLAGFVCRYLGPPGVALASVHVALSNSARQFSGWAEKSKVKYDDNKAEKKRLEAEQRQRIFDRLGGIDGILNAYPHTEDKAERAIGLQEAANLLLDLSRQQIPVHVLTHPDVLEKAKATSATLERVGLGAEPLHHDIRTLFNGFESVPEGTLVNRGRQAVHDISSKAVPHATQAGKMIGEMIKSPGQGDRARLEEIADRLGTIRKSLRELEAQTDPESRKQTLTGLHDEIIALDRIKISSPNSIRAPGALELARSTTERLVHIGLGDDWLTLELIRIFDL